ncbi:MAG: 3-methyl-2-oxobutanoate hydroxymethyltransferase [candidate division KSB1 bacterium]|nr:3-methyl-2-oxobutanoate hydroxymethyltransferase [candidate division KSB1 bacterium]
MIPDILAKKNVEKLSMLTCYDYSFAGILDGLVDMILVGDSLGHVILGAESTKKVSMQDMLRHLSAVRKGAPNTFVVADLPFPVSQDTNEALTRARELVENGADAVKPEGNPQLVHELVQRDIPVMSHLGLLPQTAESFKVVGRTADEAELLIQQAQDIQHAGAFSVVLECVPAALARRITADLRIPTIGIGSGPDCDGQVLVLYDLLGLFPDFKAKFVRKYLNLQSLVREAVQSYTADVKNQRFPSEEESFK